MFKIDMISLALVIFLPLFRNVNWFGKLIKQILHIPLVPLLLLWASFIIAYIEHVFVPRYIYFLDILLFFSGFWFPLWLVWESNLKNVTVVFLDLSLKFKYH